MHVLRTARQPLHLTVHGCLAIPIPDRAASHSYAEHMLSAIFRISPGDPFVGVG